MSRTGGAIPRSVRVRIGGRVQGVGYRYFAVRAADACGVTGFVRNLDDGSVEVRARGDRETLGSFLDTLRIGPRTCRVLEFDVQELEDPEAFHGFGVRY
jgi:acylphosphatase